MTEADALGAWLWEHGYLIFTTFRRYKIGEIITQLYHDFDDQQISPPLVHPFAITREATEQEYTEMCNWVKQQIGSTAILPARNYFYEVRTD